METNTFLLVIVHLVAVSYAAKDLLGTKTSGYLPKSNTWTMKYEGTQEEAEQFGARIGLEFKSKVFGNWYVLSNPSYNHLGLKDVPDKHINLKKAQTLDRKVKYIQQENYRKRVKYSLTIENEAWPKQWNFAPSQTPNMRVYQAWEMGYTGSGITVAIVGDGIDVEHPNLIPNYDSSLAYDYVTDSTDASHKVAEDGHGTNCAGLVAAANGTHCIIGIAFETTFTGVRLLGSEEEDTYNSLASMEASALTHKNEYIDIYSNSWGPDNRIDMDSLEPIVNDAFEYGIKNGRNGKGSIYTFASGNGGPEANCNTDPYSSNMYTISVAALNNIGKRTSYSEPCTSILTAAFSGERFYPKITTTGPNQTCVDDFSGTSAACPQVSGIIALTLQANPELTWRDIQHMIVELSDHSGLPHSTDRYKPFTNGAGKKVSIWSGFGLMDAKAMVENAPTWPTAPPRISCGSGNLYVDRFETYSRMTETFNVSNCLIGFLEHAHVNLYYYASFRGYVEVYLISPNGTLNKLLEERSFDNNTDYTYVSLMSVHSWGENPNGLWELTLSPMTNIDVHFVYWSLDLYGTATDPLDGIPAVGAFGSPCNSSALCGAIADGGCLKDPKSLCDKMCISCRNGYHRNVDMCEKDCPPLDAIDGGYVVLTYTQEGIIAKYSCFENYAFTSDGDIIRQCGSDGVWTGTVPVCDIDCGPPVAQVNGRVFFKETTLGAFAIYYCNYSFVLSGSIIRICSKSGEWSGDMPICRKGCGAVSTISNGVINSNNNTVGSSAVVDCDDGYEASKPNVICQTTGLWETATCDVKDCGTVPQINFGELKLSVAGSTTFRSSANVVCAMGYLPDKQSITCQSSGWELAVCTIIDCGPIPNVANGSVHLHPSNRTTYAAAAYVKCDSGYNPKQATIMCQATGNWETPACDVNTPEHKNDDKDLTLIIILVVAVVIFLVQLVVMCLLQLKIHEIKIKAKGKDTEVWKRSIMTILGSFPILGLIPIFIAFFYHVTRTNQPRGKSSDNKAFDDKTYSVGSLDTNEVNPGIVHHDDIKIEPNMKAETTQMTEINGTVDNTDQREELSSRHSVTSTDKDR